MASLSFNATTAPQSTGFDPIPAGRYTVMIIDSMMCDTKAGNGSYLKLTFKILEGEHINRLIWTNLNLDNPNPKAVEIAQSELAAICRACDLSQIDDSQELHGIPMTAQIKVKPAQGGYDASNAITGFKKYEEAGHARAPWTAGPTQQANTVDTDDIPF